jgi:nicotinate-nucleotide adenylyltransferase
MLKFFISYIIKGYFLFKKIEESIALFGGSFDPPHFGHREVVKYALEILDIDKIIVVPAFLNPFKSKSHYSPQKRLQLSKRMFNHLHSVEVSDYEINQHQSVKIEQTLKYFQQIYSVKYFIIGADNLKNIDKWYNFEYIDTQITWVIATRDGYKLDTSKLRDFKIVQVDANISSTEIRNKKDNKNR